MLNQLQVRVAAVVRNLPEAQNFVLAGGAALIVRGDVNRLTRDLDFFAESAEAVDRCLPALEKALTSAGLEVQRRQIGHGFARLVVREGSEETVVDLGADARLLPPERTGFGLILSGEELATDKVLAIFGRAEPRDFIDLAALEPRYGLSRLLEQAAEKDPGFQLAVFRQMLDRFHRLERDEFDVDNAGYRSVAQSVARWMTSVDQAAHDGGREDPNR